MGDRANEVLNDIASTAQSNKVKQVIAAILDIADEIAYMDYNDYCDFTEDDGEYSEFIESNAEYLEQLIG